MFNVQTAEKSYNFITSFEIWDLDPSFFIFYWEDNTKVYVNKKFIIHI